ncbi:MAG: TonB-dependent receptor [Gammaproteobacteria bacterium]
MNFSSASRAGARTCPLPTVALFGSRQINAQPLDGSYAVKEGFLEVGVPLLNEAPFADLLDLNSAIPRTHYSTSGGVTTWKVGINYQPVADLRVRDTLSREIRAPKINELFSGQNQGISPLQKYDAGILYRYVHGGTYDIAGVRMRF